MDTRVHASFLNTAEVVEEKLDGSIIKFTKRIKDEETSSTSQ